MDKIVIFGNSGSGKSTLAKKLAHKNSLPHLDLDTVAWLPIPAESMIPERMPIKESKGRIHRFLEKNKDWVIEGCYADLLELVIEQSNEVIFLNLPVSACIDNAKKRPWEPHKYESKAAQDKNLDMLIEWISQYDIRNDTFSKEAHEKLYEKVEGKKRMYGSNQENL